MVKKRFVVLHYSEKYYEVMDDKTNEMKDRFSSNDPPLFSARDARKKAYEFANKLNKKVKK